MLKTSERTLKILITACLTIAFLSVFVVLPIGLFYPHEAFLLAGIFGFILEFFLMIYTFIYLIIHSND